MGYHGDRGRAVREYQVKNNRSCVLLSDKIETLQQNLTQTFHQTQSCLRLKDAAESRRLAADSETKGCESKLEYQIKQL